MYFLKLNFHLSEYSRFGSMLVRKFSSVTRFAWGLWPLWGLTISSASILTNGASSSLASTQARLLSRDSPFFLFWDLCLKKLGSLSSKYYLTPSPLIRKVTARRPFCRARHFLALLFFSSDLNELKSFSTIIFFPGKFVTKFLKFLF